MIDMIFFTVAIDPTPFDPGNMARVLRLSLWVIFRDMPRCRRNRRTISNYLTDNSARSLACF
jgi:hypothetical protein